MSEIGKYQLGMDSKTMLPTRSAVIKASMLYRLLYRFKFIEKTKIFYNRERVYAKSTVISHYAIYILFK